MLLVEVVVGKLVPGSRSTSAESTGSTARSTASSTESPESTVSTVCYDAVVDFLLSGLGCTSPLDRSP